MFSDLDVLSPDEALHCLIVEDVLGEAPPPRGRAHAQGGQVRVEAVPPVDLQVLGEVVGTGEALLADLAPG